MVGGTNKPLFIRADANTRMGTGHVMRCLALGQAWMDAEEKAEGGGKKAEGGNLKPEDGEMSDGGGKKAEGGSLKPEDGEMSDGGGKKAGGGNLKPEAGEMSDGGGEKAEGGNLKADNSSLRSHPSSFPSVVFICAEIPDALAERVKSEGFDLIRINAEKGSPEDLRQTLDIISSIRFQVSSFIPPTGLRFQASSLIPPTGLKFHPSSFTQWLVTDGYHFDLPFQQGIRAAGLKLLLIDDYNHLPEYEADILVNQNIGAEEIEYHCNPDCRKLLGTKYVMLRREFRNAKPRERKGSPKNILVTMGGADPDNVTLKVIEALQELNVPDLQVTVIVGSANPHLESLQQAVDRSPFDLRLLTAVKDMPGLMQWADFCITAAGSTCWELLTMQVPFVSVVLAENQVEISKELQDQVGVPSVGWVDNEFKSRLVEILRNRDQFLSDDSKARFDVDSTGLSRIINEILCETDNENGYFVL